MQYALALLALVATVSAQTATGTPPSCSTDFPQLFEIQFVNVSSSAAHRRDLIAQRGIVCQSIPIITLKGGVMTDQIHRQAEIVSNHQFQFDPVLQSGRLYEAGFSVCQNSSVAIGGNAVFWRCGDVHNLYNENQAGGNCYPVYIEVLPCDSVDLSSTVPVSPDATSAPTSVATAASSAPSTSATTAATPSSLAGPALPSVAPFPNGNSTTAAGTPSATAPGPATSSALTAPANGASATTVSSTFGLVAAALIALAMF